MDYHQFMKVIKENIPIGVRLANPGGGTSWVLSYSDENITYQRKNSKITVPLEELYKAYSLFKGKEVYTTDLRDYAPNIFDSRRGGYSCNATFFFSILQLIGKVHEIKGEGKANHPFYVSVINE